MTPDPGTRQGSARLAWIVAASALVVAAVLGFLLVTGDDEDADDEAAMEELLFEPAASIGPDAFTASVATESGICDTELFVQELQSRPDALREWAEVLSIPVGSVPAYVETLEPMVLEQDTAVLNHGLRDGQAYPRASTLEAGTAVLVDTDASAVVQGYVTPEVPEVPPSDSTASSSTPGTQNGSTPESSEPASSTTTTAVTTTTGPATTIPGGGLPVTRFRCGNPLLPLEVEAFTPGTAETTVTTAPPGTGTTSSGSTSSSSTSSSSTSSSTSSSVPDSSSSSSSSTPDDVPGTDDTSTSSSIVVTPDPSDVDDPARLAVPLPRS